jgi:hypothetical protein
MEVKLFGDYTVSPISKEKYDSLRELHEPLIFPNRFDLNSSGALSSEEKEGLHKLSAVWKAQYELRLGFYHKRELVGWSYGYHFTHDTFRMATTGILQEHQRHGVYSAFLGELSTFLKKEGFQVILSRHYATDNQVIIPKLRFGFLVSGFELTDDFGLLLRLSYYFNETRRNALHMRSGFQQPSEEVTKLIRQY